MIFCHKHLTTATETVVYLQKQHFDFGFGFWFWFLVEHHILSANGKSTKKRKMVNQIEKKRVGNDLKSKFVINLEKEISTEEINEQISSVQNEYLCIDRIVVCGILNRRNRSDCCGAQLSCERFNPQWW